MSFLGGVISGLTGGLLGGGGGGISAFDKNSSTANSSQSTDQRQVNDSSNGGTLVTGSNNSVTDGGAFSLVSKLVDGVMTVTQAQTVAARDIATGINSGPIGASAQQASQSGGLLGMSATQTQVAMAVAAALAVAVILKGSK